MNNYIKNSSIKLFIIALLMMLGVFKIWVGLAFVIGNVSSNTFSEYDRQEYIDNCKYWVEDIEAFETTMPIDDNILNNSEKCQLVLQDNIDLNIRYFILRAIRLVMDTILGFLSLFVVWLIFKSAKSLKCWVAVTFILQGILSVVTFFDTFTLAKVVSKIYSSHWVYLKPHFQISSFIYINFKVEMFLSLVMLVLYWMIMVYSKKIDTVERIVEKT